MSNYFNDVAEFHQKFSLPVATESGSAFFARSPQLPSPREWEFRSAFIFEELRELAEGIGARDLPKSADALADLVWVILGTAHYFGIPFDAIWQEIKRANMEKRPWQEGDPIKPRNLVGLEIVKPKGWRPPDIETVIDKFI